MKVLTRIIANGLLWEGNEYLKQKQFKKALKKYEKAVNTYPRYYEAWYKMGIAYFNLDNFKEAINCLQKAVKIKPEFSSALYNMGIVYRELGDYQKAIKCFERLLNTRQKDNSEKHNMGWAYRNLIEMNDFEYADALFQQGWSYEALNKHEKAIDCYKKALEINSDHLGAKKNLETEFLNEKTSSDSQSTTRISKVDQSVIQMLDKINQRLDRIDLKIGNHDLIVRERLGEIAKTIPLPSRMDVIPGKLRETLRLIFTCSCNGEHIGEIQDKEWKKWVKLLTYGVKLGAKIVVGDYGHATTDLQQALDLYKKKETIPDQSFFLTQKERDKILEKLRTSEILEKIHYCPECMGWVCLKCWNIEKKLCKKHSKAQIK
jgi:tetratricopeptide (TPR) repeat protein